MGYTNEDLDKAVKIARAQLKEEIKSAVVKFAQNKMHSIWHNDLVKIFDDIDIQKQDTHDNST